MIRRFGTWFASAAGVWQTTLFCAVVVCLELAFPRTDPHMFWWLVALTVYSAVTQPVLAYIAAQSSRKSDEALLKLQQAEERELEILEKLRRSS